MAKNPVFPGISTLGIKLFTPDQSTPFLLNLFQQPVSAGFPSPAEDHIDQKLDLNRHFIKNPSATFYVRVNGDSMTGAGIHSGDMLIVDCSLEPVPGKVVIAVINGEHTVKRLMGYGNDSCLRRTYLLKV
jgi:DNA polymerase V